MAIPAPLSASGYVCGQIIGDLVHVRLRRRKRHARFQTAERAHPFVHVAVIEQRVLVLANGNKDILDAEIRGFQLEARRHNANHRVAVAVHHDRFPDDVRCGTELALPKACANERDGSTAEAIFFGGKKAPANRIYAEKFEKASGNHAHTHALSLSAAGDAEIVAAISRDRSKSRIAALPIQKIWIGD